MFTPLAIEVSGLAAIAIAGHKRYLKQYLYTKISQSMKTKLILFILTLLCSMGIWAATPNILAYPEPGKIYYIAGYNETQAKSAYLYANGTVLTGNISYTKGGDYAYLWLCAKTANGYTFQNLLTGKYILSATSVRHASVEGTSATASVFKLSETVQDSKCVSFQSGDNDPRWMAVSLTESKKVDRLNGSYNYSGDQWCTDYILEEYAAQTPSHNQYYYIYCDNDDNASSGTDIRQYLYNGTSSTIPVQTDESQVSLTNYAWRAIRYYDSENPTYDYFYFKNGSKYLAFHSLADSPFKWKTNHTTASDKADANGTGRVDIWGYRAASGGDRFLALNYADTENSSSGGCSDKRGGLQKYSGAWSQNFMFVIAPQTNVYKVAIKVECPSDPNAVFTYDGFDYSGDCYIYVDGNNLPATKAISVKSSDLSFKGFYLEDGTSLGKTIDVSDLTANKGVKAVFYPFKLSTNYASANWYYMKINGEYAVTDDEAPYPMVDTKQVSENGLWAFVEHGTYFYLINYASGDGYKLDMITPATMSSADSYNDCDILYDGGNTYFYNDPSSPWYLINNMGTPHILTVSQGKTNGAVTLEAVDWAELAKAAIDAYADSHARGEYFGADESLITSTKASITAMGSSFGKAQYEGMDLSALTKYPETGYYYIKRVGARNWGVSYVTYGSTGLVTHTTKDLNSIIRLTKESSVYKLSVQGLNLQPFTTNSQQAQVTTAEGCDVTLSSYSPGVGIIQNSIAGTPDYPGYSKYFHEDKSGNVVSWEHTDNASHWTIEKVEDFDVTLNSGGDGNYYATFCAPFSYTVSGATAYTLEKSGNWLVPTAINEAVPAGTPVVLKGTSGTATLTISGTSYAATPLTTTALTGTYTGTTITGDDYVLGKDGDNVGFYHWNRTDLAANRAYLQGAVSSVKGFVLMFDDDDATALKSLTPALSEGEGAIYNIAGQRLSKMQKGVNIVNGKKVLF